MSDQIEPGDVAPETWAILAGRGDLASGHPLNVSPVAASNFVLGGDRVYSRDDGTPTWEAFEQVLGGLEHGRAVAFASGMGAIAATLDLLPTGSTIALPDDCYQGVAGLVEAGASQGRWTARRVSVQDTDGWLGALADSDMVWLESPSNPLLQICDLAAVCGAGRDAAAIVVVDNTLATPLDQTPLTLGADIVVHSATKHIGGHSDLLLGAAVASSDAVLAHLHRRRSLAGATPGTLEAFLALRGIRTLPLRLARASASASVLAERLTDHPEVEAVRYPGRGTMISFDVAGGAQAADRVCRALRVVHHATSLGAVESTIERRAAVPGQRHLPPGLLRLSVGCEAAEDLWSDLARALGLLTRQVLPG